VRRIVNGFMHAGLVFAVAVSAVAFAGGQVPSAPAAGDKQVDTQSILKVPTKWSNEPETRRAKPRADGAG
jgi:hypothetical protein